MSEKTVSNEDLYQIESLIENGEFEEALRKHVWFHEVSRESPGMGGVRLSYAIQSWVELAEKFPPAMQALVELRDTNKNVLLAGNGNFDNFHDFFAINQYLDSEEDTYITYLVIFKNYPNQAKSYFHVVEDLLMKKGRFDICEVFLGDPREKYKYIEKLHKKNMELVNSGKLKGDADFQQYAEDTYTKSVCQLIEILVTTGNLESAKKVQQLALLYAKNEQIKGAI